MNRYKIALSVILLSGSLLASCSPLMVSLNDPGLEAKDSGTEIQDELVSVGFSQLGSESSWRLANTASVQDSLSTENGYFLIVSNARQKYDEQIKSLRRFISQRVDYLIFCPVIEDGWETVLAEAEEAKIPVIVLDRNINVEDPSLYTCFVGEDMEQEGIRAGKWLESDLAARGISDQDINIVVLTGTRDSSAQRGRSLGFAEIAARNPHWKILASNDGEFTIAKGKELMKRYLAEYPKIDVVVSQNDDMSLGAIEACEEAGISTGPGSGMSIISFDATRAGLEKVRSGVINVDVECNPLSGPLLKSVLDRLRAGKPVEKQYYMTEQVFTKENVEAALADRVY